MATFPDNVCSVILNDGIVGLALDEMVQIIVIARPQLKTLLFDGVELGAMREA